MTKITHDSFISNKKINYSSKKLIECLRKGDKTRRKNLLSISSINKLKKNPYEIRPIKNKIN